HCEGSFRQKDPCRAPSHSQLAARESCPKRHRSPQRPARPVTRKTREANASHSASFKHYPEVGLPRPTPLSRTTPCGLHYRTTFPPVAVFNPLIRVVLRCGSMAQRSRQPRLHRRGRARSTGRVVAPTCWSSHPVTGAAARQVFVTNSSPLSRLIPRPKLSLDPSERLLRRRSSIRSCSTEYPRGAVARLWPHSSRPELCAWSTSLANWEPCFCAATHSR